MAAYTAASRRNGNKYIPLMQRDRLQVIVKGTYCGVVLDGGYNLTEASYKSSMQQVVNRVVITNKDGKTVNTLQDAASRRKYGTVQRVYKQQDDVDNAAEARALLKGLERSGSVTALGDVRAVSGYSVARAGAGQRPIRQILRRVRHPHMGGRQIHDAADARLR